MKTGVALLNWNNSEDSIDCLNSLQHQSVKPWKIAVLDNGSSKDSFSKILKYGRGKKGIDILRKPQNTGFAVGNNIVIEHLLKSGADAIWVLNNDTIVEKDCLAILQDRSKRSSQLGCIGSYIYRYPDPKMAWYAGATFDPFTFSVQHKLELGPAERSMEEVVFITGCSMYIPRQAIQKVGLFDPVFFAYSEDFDWCLRAKNAGLKLMYCPAAILGHKVNASIAKNNAFFSAGRTSPAQQYLTRRNQLYVIRKHIQNPFRKTLSIAYWVIHSLFYMTITVLLGRFDKSKAVFKATLHGLRDPITQWGKQKIILNGVRLDN